MSLVFLVAALICFLVAGCLDAGWLIEGAHYGAWLAFGLAFYVASHLVGQLSRRQP